MQTVALLHHGWAPDFVGSIRAGIETAGFDVYVWEESPPENPTPPDSLITLTSLGGVTKPGFKATVERVIPRLREAKPTMVSLALVLHNEAEPLESYLSWFERLRSDPRFDSIIEITDMGGGTIAHRAIESIKAYEQTNKTLASLDPLITARQEKIEKTGEDYVQKTIDDLKGRETRYSKASHIWELTGFGAILAAVIAAVVFSWNAPNSSELTAAQWPYVVFLVARGLIVIGLLVAASKYAFQLSKTYMGEGLKNADRVHAISFGLFYLQAYGTNASWTDLKEAFQYWNIDNESQFNKLDPDSFDPKFVAAAVSIADAIIKSKPDKKKE